ncbi:hypothetical protein EH31_02345 [Erythrobacter longus]|uniref:Uncharacterized protein n=1 Tax=Erythrobacter longus TaxID=1044 RepID=A0A074MFF7_ERYLO|nr:hypothetical protein [Erythrobacter longus]KEO91530.1 hypothetical protein EH31_02345 [Erythrobacter longus]
MNGAVIAFMIAGLVGFGAGAYLSATGERPIGIGLMAMGLLFQVLTLRQLRMARKGANTREGSNDAG